MTFGERLKRLRESHKPKIYQKELADAIGVSRQAITMWETDQRIPDTVTLQKLADYFGVTTDHLLGRPEKQLANKREDISIEDQIKGLLRADSDLTEDEKNNLSEQTAKFLQFMKQHIRSKKGERKD